MRCLHLLPAALLAFGLLRAANADVTYTYTGNDFNQFFDAGPYYHPGDRVTATITFNGQLDFDNYTQLYGYSQIVTASVSDGHVTLTQAVPNNDASVEIDAQGKVVYWGLYFDDQAHTTIDSAWSVSGLYRADFSTFYPDFRNPLSYAASNEDDPGTWSGPVYSTTPTPEPSSIAVLGTGLAALVGLLAKRSA